MGFIRNFLAWMSVPVLCMLALPLYILRPFNPDNNRLLAIAMARTGRLILGMKRPLEGAEHMPQDRPVVAIANHQYNDDLFVVGDLVAPRTVIVGKSSLIWFPFFGWVFWLGGNVMLNRAHSRKAIAAMQAISDAITRDNKSLWVFVEGTRSKGRGLQKFKKGAFYAAVTAGAPIVMVCTAEYRNKTLGWFGRREPVAIRILPPVETTGLTTADVPALIARCHKEMAETIANL
ncbi:MAG: 1-acylglycerol-3-phosphate O-acyltransferase [Marinobacter sp.]|uniref:lysophospholipid acyltransferase family protein n=1 Tax=Marinobacter sp. TaxID=50741 RepID=UPI001B5EAE99|nr:1-acylglycerol-3-phosphate O-acyltransferase [Marinobacter sp.]MBQ0747537.1 1-acylglycerol-3-phosphate O-acyltransferase [Marinobacter sp.]MBQ0815438.1 1-acylglycerol-3-phosphate O-acyltransferase [Marinobacter sp.]|tara:strand:+ start:1696 stop:2394 length:699 start_codon:yes stop_codon:yes gene_type:complete